MNPTIDIKIIKTPAQYLPPPPLQDGGGESIFLGRTRTETHPQYGKLLALEYDAYESMAIKKLTELANQAAQNHQALHIVIHHTQGKVPVGAASVFIQILAPHRDQSFQACRYLIDQLKVDVPIWKSELWEHGKTTWKDGQAVPVK